MPLEPRLLLSALLSRAHALQIAAQDQTPGPPRASSRQGRTSAQAPHAEPGRSTPQYAAFTAGFRQGAERLRAIRSTSNRTNDRIGTSHGHCRRTRRHRPVIQVDNAAVFGPEGACSTRRWSPTRSSEPSPSVNSRSPAAPGIYLIVRSPRCRQHVDLARWHRSDSQRSHFGPDAVPASIFPSLHHEQHDPDGHQSGEVLQQASNQAAAGERSAAYARSARRDPDLRLSTASSAPRPTSLYQYTNGSSSTSLQQLLLAIPLPTTDRLGSADLQGVGR